MKKVISIIMSLILTLAFLSGPAIARPDNWQLKEHGNSGKILKEKTTGIEKQNEMKQVKATKFNKSSNRIKVKSEVKEQFQNKNKNNEFKKHFSDTQKHWASNSIDSLSELGLFNGYPDGSFKPDNSITQAEAISLVMRISSDDAKDSEIDEIADDEEENTDEELEEVPGWARKAAGNAAKKGVININRFHSPVQASRAQTAVWIAKAVGLEPVDTSDMPFNDGILISAEDVGYIMALYQQGIIKGSPGGKFNPNSAISRAEMAAIMERLLAADISIESIDLPSTVTIERGQSIQLTARVNYSDGSSDDNLSWSSSNTDLLTVNAGQIKAAADKTGTAVITATASKGESTFSASCEVSIVESLEIIDAVFESTGKTGVVNAKVYEEYILKVDDNVLDLQDDTFNSIIFKQDSVNSKLLSPESSNFLFNIENETAQYSLSIISTDGIKYNAVLDWNEAVSVEAEVTGNELEKDGDNYLEYRIANIDLSTADCIYQIQPDDSIIKLSGNSAGNLWLESNISEGNHVLLIKKNSNWYSTTISK